MHERAGWLAGAALQKQRRRRRRHQSWPTFCPALRRRLNTFAAAAAVAAIQKCILSSSVHKSHWLAGWLAVSCSQMGLREAPSGPSSIQIQAKLRVSIPNWTSFVRQTAAAAPTATSNAARRHANVRQAGKTNDSPSPPPPGGAPFIRWFCR